MSRPPKATLVAIVAASSTMAILIVFLRFWKPKRVLNANGEDTTGLARRQYHHSRGKVFKAWMPWLVLSVVVFVWGLPQFSHWMCTYTTLNFSVTGLHNVIQRIPPAVAKPTTEVAVFTFNWLTATGTGILVAALFAGLLMGLGPGIQTRSFLHRLQIIAARRALSAATHGASTNYRFSYVLAAPNSCSSTSTCRSRSAGRLCRIGS